MITLKKTDGVYLTRLAYSIWKGDLGLYASNRKDALRLLVELHGACQSECMGAHCQLFAGHSVNDPHEWSNARTNLTWDDRPEPVTPTFR